MTKYYTNEKQAQVIIALLKAHGIRKVIASPGATNVTFVGSLQNDPYFEIYSSVDERSAAYIACGLTEESGEPVVISCTGATSSQNYMPGLIEAFYRKLPILAITSTQPTNRISHHIAQVTDRTIMPKDALKLSVELPIIKDDDDLWDCEIKVNKAILELKRGGGGPVHINLPTDYSKSYDIKELPKYRVISRITQNDRFPELAKGKIGIFVGAHSKMSKELTETIDQFCSINNAVVFCDHTSNYYGKYRLLFSLVAAQQQLNLSEIKPDVLIHIGEISGDYYNLGISGHQVWRVNEDGEIRDTFRKLRYVFEMPELNFFNHYAQSNNGKNTYFIQCKELLTDLQKKLPELPFSNIWLASKLAHQIPQKSAIHFGILNSLRSWNFFELPESITSASNVGGFGIDGGLSTFIGASLANKNKLYFLVIGDLAFFYDMNVLGNRHVGNNIRILLVNNGKGTEFRQFNHVAAQFEEDADKFISAAGHFGNKSQKLVKHYAEDLGFEYLCASDKQQFEQEYKRFLTPEITERPMLFEVFTNSDEESDALKTIMNIEENVRGKAKQFAKQVLGENNLNLLKKVIGR